MPSQLLKISPRHQLTIPRRIMDRFGVTSHFELMDNGNELVLRPARIASAGDSLSRVRDKIRKLGITEDIVAEAVRHARSKKA